MFLVTNITAALSDLGARIAVLRRARRLRQEDLAQAAGVGRSTISEIENGSANTEIGNYLRVLEVLEVLDDVNIVGRLSASDLSRGAGRRAGRVRLLPADHRAQKSRKQEQFLASGHPGAFGLWKGVEVRIIEVPDIGDASAS
jgi:transcriptional regulator with XRE-family HTH domain